MRKSSHVQYDIEYHIVWTTKYRYRVIEGNIAERARKLIIQSCHSMNVTIIKGSIGREHVHLLVSCPPSLSVSKLVQQLKGKTSRTLQMEYSELKKKYWGRHLYYEENFKIVH